MAFSPGDVVKLHSGGPSMTVAWVEPADEDGSENVVVVWFSETVDDRHLHEASVPAGALRKT